jgi:hypothetical protein
MNIIIWVVELLRGRGATIDGPTVEIDDLYRASRAVCGRGSVEREVTGMLADAVGAHRD